MKRCHRSETHLYYAGTRFFEGASAEKAHELQELMHACLP
jgi:hypothetical protein